MPARHLFVALKALHLWCTAGQKSDCLWLIDGCEGTVCNNHTLNNLRRRVAYKPEPQGVGGTRRRGGLLPSLPP